MAQKYIEGDIVEYDNKVMVIKEPRDGNHFDLSCPKEGLVYCFVGVDEIKPMELTLEIIEKNGWEFRRGFCFSTNEEGILICLISQGGGVWDAYTGGKPLHSGINSVSDLQHLLFGLGINHEMEV